MFSIDVSRSEGKISPFLFGHNLEHTRSCMWQGLSAELVQNRKFAGLPQRNGAAQHWYPIGPRQSWHLLEQADDPYGTAGEAYTIHFDRTIRLNKMARQRQKVQSLQDGVPCGIGQREIFLVSGKRYQAHLALLSDRELSVRVRLLPQSLDREYFQITFQIQPGQWKEFPFTFTAPRTDGKARIEMTFERTGTLYFGAVSLLPGDHFHAMRRDVIELLKEISVPILRWPGGNFAGDYRWKDGLLPVDRRAPLRNYVPHTLPHTDGYDTHEVGIDEFIALCRELKAEPYLTTNMGLEGPEEAAAWVEYCNGSLDTTWGRLRAERGHPRPYNVKYWSLGNEMGYGHMPGPNTPIEYCKKAVVCARAMKKADPTIVLTFSGAWWQEKWYSDALPRIEAWVDHVAYHTYTPLMASYDGEKGKEEFRRIARASDGVLEDLKKVRARLDAHTSDGDCIRLAFDEWNVWYAWYRVPGVVEGIHTASMLNMLCRKAQELGIAISAYFEPVNEGAILVDSRSCRLTPAGQVFSLYRAHQTNQLIQLELPWANLDVDFLASVDHKRKEVVITLVNRSLKKSKETGFTLKNIQEIVSIECLLLCSTDFLPGSQFTQQQTQIGRINKHSFTLSVPQHSVARILARYQ